MITIETSRTPKPNDIDDAVAAAESRAISINGIDESSLDLFEDFDIPEFVPKVGIFGAPMCRLTTSVISLVGMMAGMVMATSGACILLFVIQEEPVYVPLGYTLMGVGSLLLFIGTIMWTSEFMCNDCLAQAYRKIKSAPLKNAIKRRERLIASRSTTRTGSRLSTSSSLKSHATESTVVSRRY